jgi:hypothetical protein
MTFFSKLFVSAALYSLSISSPVLADATARYGELQAVIDAINDPDPLMRLAQLEEILKKGDATEVQLAIRTAFSVEDPNVRSLALRAHFAGFKTFVITAQLPEEWQKAAESEDKAALANISNSYLMRLFRDQGYQFSFQSEYPGVNNLEFKVKVLNDQRPADDYTGSGNIRGGMINIVTAYRFANSQKTCSFELAEFKGFTLKGFGSCNVDGGALFPVTLHLFDDDEIAAKN